MEEVFKSLGEFFAGIVLVVAPLTVRYVKKRYEERNYTSKKMDISVQVNDILVELRQKYNVDRLGVIEFSNGEQSVTGFPFLYVTMTYEKCRVGILPMKAEMNKVPASWFIHFNSYFCDHDSAKFGSFFDNGDIFIGGSSSFLNKIDVANDLVCYGVKSNWTFKIGNNISNGLLNLAFINEKKQFTTTEIQDIQTTVSRIAHLFKHGHDETVK